MIPSFKRTDGSGPIILDLLCFLIISIIAYCDYHTGRQISLSYFYVIPVLVIAWYGTRFRGIAASVFAALAWLAGDISLEFEYSHPLIPFWNAALMLAFYLTSSVLLSSLKKSLDREHKLSRIDYLTGALNTRAFMEAADHELNRMERYGTSFTMVYLDLDNFKDVNDRLGHITGDELLRLTAQGLRNSMRNTDVIARLGGDEFGILLPETSLDHAEQAVRHATEKMLDIFRSRNWPVTFSVGIVQYKTPPESVDACIRYADDLMYRVKKRGKNSIEKELVD